MALSLSLIAHKHAETRDNCCQTPIISCLFCPFSKLNPKNGKFGKISSQFDDNKKCRIVFNFNLEFERVQ